MNVVFVVLLVLLNKSLLITIHLSGVCKGLGICYQYLQIPNNPVTLQAVCTTVRGFTRWQTHLQGCLIASEIWCFHHTPGGMYHS